MRLPLTNVPFVEPRSSTISCPDASRYTRACTREISLSPPRLPTPGVERPITSSCSSWMSCPVAFPAVTFSNSPAIQLEPNHAAGRTARGRLACPAVKAGERRGRDAGEEQPADDYPGEHGPRDSQCSPATRGGHNGARKTGGPEAVLEPASEVVVVHDRQVAEAAQRL